MKTLILTEKPSVAKDFAKALGVPISAQGFYENEKMVITWAIGHLLELKSPENYDPKWKKWSLDTLPILPDRLSYKANSKTRKQLSIVKYQLKRQDLSQVVVATDAGREGELIARTLLMSANSKLPTYRFWTSQALNKSVIIENLKKAKPLTEYDRLYYAGRARQSADWLVGMNLTRVATIKMGDLFTVGRVQTAVLSLLVKRYFEIHNFKSEDYFQIQGEFNFEKGSIAATWFDPLIKKESSRIESEQQVQSILENCRDKSVQVKEKKVERISRPSPQLFSLTELQKVANRAFGFSAKKTLGLAQALYEKKKCLSYPRTDSRVLGTQSLGQVEDILGKLRGEYEDYFKFYDVKKLSLSNRLVFNDAKLTDHHALIPLKAYKGSLSSDEGKIYNLITKRFISCFSSNLELEETSLILNVGAEHFRTRGQSILNQGWKYLSGGDRDNLLTYVEQSEVGEIKDLSTEKKSTRPPLDYTEATLLQDMVNPSRLVEQTELKKVFRAEVGLGTQATRAQIIETLLQRNYIARTGKNLVALDKGLKLIEVFSGMSISNVLASAEQTAKWELDLNQIAEGGGDPKAFMLSIRDFIQRSTDEWKSSEVEKVPSFARSRPGKKGSTKRVTVGSCPVCKGNVIETAKSYGCERWQEGCKFTIWKVISGRTISATQAKKIIENGRSGEIKGFKSKSGKKFDASLIFNGQRMVFDF